MKKMKRKIGCILLIGIIIVSGFVYTKTSDAASIKVDLKPWTFYQAGQYDASNPRDVAYINSVQMFDTWEKMTDWKRGNDMFFADYSMEERTAEAIDRGFSLDIENAGSTYEDPVDSTFEPWEIQAKMNNISLKKGHIYSFSFNARASSRKNAYIEFENNGWDSSYPVFYKDDLVDENGNPANQTIAITSDAQRFSYVFTASAGAPSINFIINLGCFRYTNDHRGVDQSSVITDPENQINWKGIVDIGKFSIIDMGLSNEFIDDDYEDESTSPYQEETTTYIPEQSTRKTDNKSFKTKKYNQVITIPKSVRKQLKSVPLNKKKVPLKAKASGKGKLTYKSSNKKILTVNNKGTITIKKCGNATITIRANSNGNYLSAKKKIKVVIVPASLNVKITKNQGKTKASWQKNSGNKYEIEVSKRRNFSGGVRKIKPKKSKVIFEHNKNRKYYIRIRAVTSNGIKGKWSKVYRV